MRTRRASCSPPDKQVAPHTEFKLTLLLSSYVEIAPPVRLQEEQEAGVDGGWFRRDDNFYHSEKIVLLESMIGTLLKDEQPNPDRLDGVPYLWVP